jgi:short-subunit dehydrogenase
MGFRERYGPWALVVGGSDGIGAAFAEQLAGRGLHLVLVARRVEPLDRYATELRDRYGVEVRTLPVDGSAPDAAERILAGTAEVDLGLLVCSAAAAPVGSFLAAFPGELDRLVALNCALPTRLAQAVGNRLVDRGRGGIILLSSVASQQGTALVVPYAASKAYVRVLAEGLWAELRPAGVDVLACCPGRVSTATYLDSQPGDPGLAPPVMPAAPVARAALAALGHKPVVVPGVLNALAGAVATRLLPRRAAVTLSSRAIARMYPS